MIEEEILKNIIKVISIILITVFGSYLLIFYSLQYKKMIFYEDARKMLKTMSFMKTSFSPPSYKEVFLHVPKGCRITINTETDIVEFGCEEMTRIAMKRFNVDILLVQGGKGCKIENGTIKEGEYKIILAFVEEIPEKTKECVVYFR